ncbi:gluconate 2-dehydrogenase subunit 3 family protein [Luteolibacter luteus]|uniref:Gluconate 2-dehydrogenase subunit 3 family protein n=1 Tax=Luteolibacter luteus TaxID=2728835 RepID=A0A858RDP3_9BACT|nr:gluconate 2-dehydrogenase subunit 3 family protein [Luteolibacter luteus]QJE94440.1 gluconate 2-dehydrogenase subunit 3 family protein [Luteolibacter luteus]
METPSFFNASFTRRVALKRVAALSAALATVNMPAFGQAAGAGKGIGHDPNLLAKDIPWKLQLVEREMMIVTLLCDVIIPADEHGPAASKVGVPEFINEWVSAPYDAQIADLEVVRKGLEWFDAEANRRFGRDFPNASPEQHLEIVTDLVKEGTPAREQGFGYFEKIRFLTIGGYFSTPEGWKAIGYVGNVPMAEFPGPPPEVLKHLGLA